MEEAEEARQGLKRPAKLATALVALGGRGRGSPAGIETLRGCQGANVQHSVEEAEEARQGLKQQIYHLVVSLATVEEAEEARQGLKRAYREAIVVVGVGGRGRGSPAGIETSK